MELAMKDSSAIKVSDEIFGRDFSEALVHQVVTAYLAGGRSGTKAQKNRAAASGGGRKPWRQKGTGNARAGSIRSPIWRGGGVTFAAQPRDHSHKVNRKQYRAGLKSILSELVRQDRLVVVENLSVDEPRTRLVSAMLNELNPAGGRTVLVDAEIAGNLYLGSRNLRNVYVREADALDPVTLVSADKVVLTRAAVEKIQEWLA